MTTDTEARALEAAYKSLIDPGTGDRTLDTFEAAMRAYHAAILDGSIVISREDAEALFEIIGQFAEWERVNGTLAHILPDEYEGVGHLVSRLAQKYAFRLLEGRIRAQLEAKP